MPSIRAQRIAFAYSDAQPLFEDSTFHLPSGWTGLVGENGAGKTTLLRLLAGELKPTAGSLETDPPDLRLTACPQDVESPSPVVQAFAGAADAEACRRRGRLALEPRMLRRWNTLSPGERRRWQVGAALWECPDALLLDEPTNHLDAPARQLLVRALREFDGVGIVVSHDRALLEALTTRTLRLHAGRIECWSGSYDSARREWLAHEEMLREKRDRAQAEQRRLESHRRSLQRQREAAEAQRSTRRRMRNPNDSDARSLLAAGRAEMGERGLARRASVARRRVERAMESVGEIAIEPSVGGEVFLRHERAPMPWLFALDSAEVRAGDRVVLRDVRLAVSRDDRVRVCGPNGSGKTTLLRALLADSRLPADRLLHLPQELASSEAEVLLHSVCALAPDVRGRVLSLVAALGSDPGRLLASRHPSPGEARKLAIADALGRAVWALVLDEPTNHLDLPSVERLEHALRDWPGALLLVTHDDTFARSLVRTNWELRGGAIGVRSCDPPLERRAVHR